MKNIAPKGSRLRRGGNSKKIASTRGPAGGYLVLYGGSKGRKYNGDSMNMNGGGCPCHPGHTAKWLASRKSRKEVRQVARLALDDDYQHLAGQSQTVGLFTL